MTIVRRHGFVVCLQTIVAAARSIRRPCLISCCRLRSQGPARHYGEPTTRPASAEEPRMQTSPSRAQRVWDLVLALCCVAVALPIQVTGIDAVPANPAPDAGSVLLTLAALLPLAWRRRAPLVVFAACFPGFLGLIGAPYSVGAAPIGVLIGFYTVAACDNRRNARVALVVAGMAYGVRPA